MEIHDMLKENSFEKIIWDFVSDFNEQYFDEIIRFTEDEIFVDAGVYDGATSLEFAKRCNYKYNKICLFEPNNQFNDIILNNMKDLNHIELHNVGLWHYEDILSFEVDKNGGGNISPEGDTKINVNALDNILKKGVTFIKMDIEGAELNALKGACEIIKQYKPKLAISIYHKPEDIIDIPVYIKFLVPEYKFYIRHYTSIASETVLYCIIQTKE